LCVAIRKDCIVEGRMREAADCEREALMQLVSFKWLMSGKGWSVDVRRIQDEPAYADSCLRRGAASDLAPLRRCSGELRGLLDASARAGHPVTAAPLSGSQPRWPQRAADLSRSVWLLAP